MEKSIEPRLRGDRILSKTQDDFLLFISLPYSLCFPLYPLVIPICGIGDFPYVPHVVNADEIDDRYVEVEHDSVAPQAGLGPFTTPYPTLAPQRARSFRWGHILAARRA